MSGAVTLRLVDGGVRLAVRVLPRAARSELAGVRNGRLVVRVTAPPVDRAANEAAAALIAGALGLPRRSVSVVAGMTSRAKTLEIRGTTVQAVERLVADQG